MDKSKIKNIVDLGKLVVGITKAIRERKQSRKDVLDNDATPLLGFRKRILNELEENDKEQEDQNEAILFLSTKIKELEERIAKLESPSKVTEGKHLASTEGKPLAPKESTSTTIPSPIPVSK